MVNFPGDFQDLTVDDNTVLLASPSGTSTTYGKVNLAALRLEFIKAGLLNNVVNYTGTLTVAPTGNPNIATTTALNIQATANQTNKREFLLHVGLTSGVGANVGNSGDKVAGYFGIVGNSGSGNIWAINTVNIVNARMISQSIECDTNNMAFDADLGTPVWGISITGSGSHTNAGYMLFIDAAQSNRWTRGLYVAANSVSTSTIEDFSSSYYCLNVTGQKNVVIDTLGANVINGVMRMRRGQMIFWSSLDGSSVSEIYQGGEGNMYYGIGSSGNFLGGAAIAPQNDQGAACGTGFNRWNSIYAVSGTVFTSDEREKNFGPELSSMTDFFMEMPIEQFQWKVGEKIPTQVIVKKPQPKIKTITRQVMQNELVDGKWVSVPKEVEETEHEFVHVPVYHHETGEQIINQVARTQKVTLKDGTIVDQPILDNNGNPLIHEINQTHIEYLFEDKDTVDTQYIDRPGKRWHIGMRAQKLKELLDKYGMGDEYSMWCLADPNDPESRQMTRTDQIFWVGMKTLQEQKLRLDEKEAQLNRLLSDVEEIKSHLKTMH